MRAAPPVNPSTTCGSCQRATAGLGCGRATGGDGLAGADSGRWLCPRDGRAGAKRPPGPNALRQPARITADAVPGMTMDGVVENINAVVVENPLANNVSRQVRQVMISVSGGQQQTPIGLRVSVRFSPCVSGQSGPGK